MPVSSGGGGLLSPWLCPIFGGTGCSSTSPMETPSSSSPSPSTANPPQIATSPPIDSPPSSGPGSTSSDHPPDVTSTAPPPASSALDHTRAVTSPATPVHPTSHRAPPAPTFHLSSTSLTSTLVSTGTPNDSSTPASFVGRGSSSILSLPTPTSTLPAHHSRLSTDAVIGIAVAIGVIANLLMLALCSYARRGRTRVRSSARADQSTDADRCGDRAPETAEDVRRQTCGDSWASNSVRRIDSEARRTDVADCPAADLLHARGCTIARVSRSSRSRSRCRSRGESNGTVHGSDKVLQDYTDLDDLNLAVGRGSTADGQMGAMVGIPVSAGYEVAYRRVTRHEIDGGVRIAGGRPGEGGFDQESMSDGSVTLPPPYPSHLDEEDTDEAIEAPGALGQYWGGSVRVE